MRSSLQLIHNAFLVLGFVAAVLVFWCSPAIAQQGAAPVGVSSVVEREITAGQTFIGTVVPMRKSIVGSAVDGRVILFSVKEGDWVTKDQPIAQLLTETLEIELAGARAELQLRQHELEELQNGSRPEEIMQAKANLLGAKALVDFASAKYRRWQSLYEQGRSTSLEELEDAKSKATAAEQVYAAAQAAYELSVQGPRQEKVSQAKARVLVQQEIVRAIEDRLKKFTIRAPFDGYVVAENTEVGEWISQADPIAEVVELDPVEINVSVPEIHVASIQVGMMVSIRIDAAGTGTLEGVIARIVPQADIRSRTFPVRVRVANPKTASGHVLKSGMLARVTVPVGKKQQSLMVPKDALVLGGPTPSVYVVVTDPQSKQSTARPVSVQTGVAEGAWIQVSGALQAGQQVVVQGNERLLPGQAIRVAEVLSPK